MIGMTDGGRAGELKGRLSSSLRSIISESASVSECFLLYFCIFFSDDYAQPPNPHEQSPE
jgi:hypothetical protein